MSNRNGNRSHGFWTGWTLAALVGSMLAAGATGCEAGDPAATGGVSSGTGGLVDVCFADEMLTDQENAACTALPTDYMPRDNASALDSWPACISDDNQYHQFEPNISSIARVAAFEQIAKLLSFGGGKAPSPSQFLDARLAYAQDEGLASRVARREDEHYPPAPTACRDLSPAEQMQYPDRCVGPVKMQPLLNQAFEDGIAGADPVGNAARIEAGLLWFLYMSIYKEARTCAIAAKDCDSSYAKYTGGNPRDMPLGFSRYVEARSLQAHDRIWDGVLAVRCWRDLDNPTGVAMNTALHDQASAQLDRALLRGLALIVRQRLQAIDCASAWESVRILGTVLDREATVRDPVQAELLRSELAKPEAALVDTAAAIAAIDMLFPCP